ncbi:MAG: DUF1385 domain-containing protein [Clostridia bacterium]|nr:DUF1385 domain-containing protein [Clostridia bacterium]
MSKNEKVSVGGQALIEGIMMQGPKCCAVSLRMPDGSIETTEKKLTHIKDKYPIFGKPVIRGVVNFVESMILGYKCLMESAEKTSLDFEEEENMSKFDKWILDHFGPKMMTIISVIAIILSVGLGFFLFMWLPALIADGLNNLTSGAIAFLRPLIEGILRMAIFVGYMIAVAQMKDIKRVFMYHGAEHKSIFCYEKGLPLTVENVKAQSRLHPRCGTSFIFVVLIISILISSIIGLIPGLRDLRALWMVIKLLLLPVVAGVAYEFIKYAGKNEDKKWVCVLSKPGLWMQKITTNEPTDDIIEVGIAALNAALYGIDAVEETTEEKAEETVEETTDEAIIPEEDEIVIDETLGEDLFGDIESIIPRYKAVPVRYEEEIPPLEDEETDDTAEDTEDNND